MLTPDARIDRRILLEANALLAEGFDVYVLAEPFEDAPEFGYELGVPVERVVVRARASMDWTRLYDAIIAALTAPPGIETEALRRSMSSGDDGTTRWRRLAGRLVFRVRRSFAWRSRGIALRILRRISAITRRRAPKLMDWRPAWEQAHIDRVAFYRPDVIHCHDLPMLKIAVAAKRKTGARLVYDMHEFYPEQLGLSAAQQRSLREVESAHIRRAERLITVNPLLAEAISRAYGGLEIAVVQNATQAPPDLHTNRRDLFRKRLALDQAPIFLYQGWMSPVRNLEALILGAALASRDLHLVLMGYGDYATELRAIAGTTSRSHRIHFVEAVSPEQLLYYTASADVGVIPYGFGGDVNTRLASPNKLYEFIAARVPILTNELPFVASVVGPNGFGVVADLESSEAVAAALDDFPLGRIEEFRERLAIGGSRYLWQSEKERLLEIYEPFGSLAPLV